MSNINLQSRLDLSQLAGIPLEQWDEDFEERPTNQSDEHDSNDFFDNRDDVSEDWDIEMSSSLPADTGTSLFTMTLDSMQKPPSTSETLLEYLEREEQKQQQEKSHVSESLSPIEELLTGLLTTYNSLNLEGLLQNINLPMATHTVQYLQHSVSAQYAALYRVLSSGADAYFDNALYITLIAALQHLLAQITEQLQFSGDNCTLFKNGSSYDVELLSAVLYCSVDRCSPLFHYYVQYPNNLGLLSIFMETLRTELSALNILRHIGVKYAALVMQNEISRGYRERYEDRLRQLNHINDLAPFESYHITDIYANYMSAFLFTCCGVSPITGAPSSRSAFSTCNNTTFVRACIRPYHLTALGLDAPALMAHYFAVAFHPVAQTISLLEQENYHPMTEITLRIAFGQFIKHIFAGEISLQQDEMTLVLNQCSQSEEEYLSSIFLFTLYKLKLVMEQQNLSHAVSSLAFCSPIILSLFIAFDSGTDTPVTLILHDIEIILLQVQSRQKEEMRIIKQSIVVASQAHQHTSAIRYCKDALHRMQTHDVAEHAFILDLLSTQHIMLGQYDDAIAVMRDGVDMIYHQHPTVSNNNSFDDYQISVFAESLHLKLCILLLNYDAPGHAVMELQKLYLNTVRHQWGCLIDRQVAVLSWLAKAYLKIHGMNTCRQVLRHIKQLQEQSTEYRTPRHTPRGSSHNNIVGYRERDSTTKLGVMFSDTLEPVLPAYCTSKHSINLGEMFGRLYLAWHRPLAALKHLLPTIIVVELSAHQCNYEPGALSTLGRLYYLYGKVYRYIAETPGITVFPFNIGSKRLFEAVVRVFNECNLVNPTGERFHQRRYSKTHHSASSSASATSYRYGIPTLAHSHRFRSAQDAKKEAIVWFRRSMDVYAASGNSLRAAKSAIALSTFVLCQPMVNHLLSPSLSSLGSGNESFNDVIDVLTSALSTVTNRMIDLPLMLTAYITMAELRLLQNKPADALAYTWEASDTFAALYVHNNSIPLLRRISYNKGMKVYNILQRLVRLTLAQSGNIVREYENILQLCVSTSYQIKRLERQAQCWVAIGSAHLMDVMSVTTTGTPRTQMSSPGSSIRTVSLPPSSLSSLPYTLTLSLDNTPDDCFVIRMWKLHCQLRLAARSSWGDVKNLYNIEEVPAIGKSIVYQIYSEMKSLQCESLLHNIRVLENHVMLIQLDHILVAYHSSTSTHYVTCLDEVGLLGNDVLSGRFEGVLSFLRHSSKSEALSHTVVPVAETSCICGTAMTRWFGCWEVETVATTSQHLQFASPLYLVCSCGVHRVEWEQLLPELDIVRRINGRRETLIERENKLLIMSMTTDIPRRLKPMARVCDLFRAHSSRMPSPPVDIIQTAVTYSVSHGPLFVNMMHGEKVDTSQRVSHSGILPLVNHPKIAPSYAIDITEPSYIMHHMDQLISDQTAVLFCPLTDWTELPDLYLRYLLHGSSTGCVAFIFASAENIGHAAAHNLSDILSAVFQIGRDNNYKIVVGM